MGNYGKTARKIKALAYLHRYGWIVIMVGLIAIFPNAALYFLSVGFITDSIWTIIGYKYKWKHIFCSFQLAYRKTYNLDMTPDSIRWGWVKKSNVYVSSIIMAVLGLGFLVLAIVATIAML